MHTFCIQNQLLLPMSPEAHVIWKRWHSHTFFRGHAVLPAGTIDRRLALQRFKEEKQARRESMGGGAGCTF